MTTFATPQVTPLGATAFIAHFGDHIERELSSRIARLVEHLERQDMPGIVDLIPSYTSLVVMFDTDRTELDVVVDRVLREWTSLSDSPITDEVTARLVEIPVVYGGDAGPDLDDVSRSTGMSPDDVVRRHSEAEYTVGALGFSPGFAFLIGLPPELAAPRRGTPRTRVPAGSVGIGGAQTGIYSLPTPGGWSLIGRTPRVMFDPEHESRNELRLGDRVRFVPTSADEVSAFPEPTLAGGSGMGADGAIEIVEAGVQTSVQDLGRPGHGRQGITPGGAVDRSALVAGNRLLGNPDGAAALEWTLIPPAVRFDDAARIALTGADAGWSVGERAVSIGEVVEIVAGDVLRARPAADMLGARGYLCVAGGIDVPEVRGSRSLDLSAGFGGGHGRPLRAGDRVSIGEVEDNPVPDHSSEEGCSLRPAAGPFRVVRGPQADRFGERAWSTFLSEAFTVDPQSNRMGLRLNGPAIPADAGADLISEGLVTGTIQVTGSGQPIVLMPGRATIGGYTRIATVIEADHDRLGQLRPGDAIRFAEVSVDEAREALRGIRPSIYGGLHGESEGDDAMTKDQIEPSLSDAWTPDGVIRVVRELAAQEVRAFSLRVESAGLEIAIDRGGGLPGRSPANVPESAPPVYANDEPSDNTPGAVVAAPLLGTFYRRPSPEAPLFVEVGSAVEPGQTVGLIEVMKSFHEVTAEIAGTVTRILVDEGEAVEFGQPLMELEPAP